MNLKSITTSLLLVLSVSTAFATETVTWFSSDGRCHIISENGDDQGVVSDRRCGGNTYQRLGDGACHEWSGGDTDLGVVSDQLCGGNTYQRLSDGACHEWSGGDTDLGVVSDQHCN